jgi:hypothetical protein
VFLLTLPALVHAQSDCHNVLTGGLICCDQTVCPGKTPQAILESQAPEGADNLIEYEWHRFQVLPNGSSTWEVIPDALAAAYQPGALSETSFFLREARRQGCTDWLVANMVTITVAAPGDPACDASVSTQEFAVSLSAVQCVPSPFTEKLLVRNGAAQKVRVQVFDAFGKPVAGFFMQSGAETTLETSDWPQGLYVIRMEGANGEQRARPVVKM